MLLRSVGTRINQTGLLRNSRFYPGSLSLISTETSGFALDFLDNTYAMRTFNADELLSIEASGLALEFISNTSAVRI